jgi:hypothetical protein
MLDWLMQEFGIEPHIPVFDKSQRTDDTLSRDDFTYDHTTDTYRCAGGISAPVCDAADRHNEGQLDALPGQQA